MAGSRGWRIAKVVGYVIVRVLWISTMILVPLFGFWLSSSLAAFNNASQWVSLLVGLALFPLVPLAWDLVYVWRRNRKNPEAKQILTRLDRLVLRTLLLNGAFLGVMMWRAPQTSFRALAVRGDWILDGHDGDVANAIRGAMLGFADKFEKRWHEVDDRYGKSDDVPSDVEPTDVGPTGTDPSELEEPSAPDAPAAQPKGEWPVDPEPDVQVTDMPADQQASIEAVASYLKIRFPEQKRLAKAVHDYVALRLTYDDATLAKIVSHDYTNIASQDAETVFRTKTGVCEGYARLFAALGKAAGLETAYVTGYIRDAHRRVSETNANGTDATVKAALEGYLHAWNAVKLDGNWYLVDTTWDDPKGADKIESTYFLTPPKYFAYDHLPDEPKWQLVTSPISPGDFVRQPLLTPRAGTFGVSIVSPDRSQVTVDGAIEIELANPYKAEILADYVVDGEGEREGKECRVSGNKIRCEVGKGEYEVRIFASKAATKSQRSFRYNYIGSILANGR